MHSVPINKVVKSLREKSRVSNNEVKLLNLRTSGKHLQQQEESVCFAVTEIFVQVTRIRFNINEVFFLQFSTSAIE